MTPTLLGSVIGAAVLFALLYYPALERLSFALVSPYPKADLGKRLSAVMVDGLIIVTMLVLFRQSGSVAYLASAAVYVLLRDAPAGRSVGKFCLGLVVIDVRASRPCGGLGSAKRNVMLLLPGANLVALFLEGATVARDSQGQRLGDRIAQTQVVEGFGLKDLAARAVEWWRDFVAQLDGSPRRPRRVRTRA